MTQIDALKEEFEHEAQTTRTHLERLPGDRLAWRPHEKSFTAGELASHLVDCVGWADAIFTRVELDVKPGMLMPFQATSVDDLLKAFDEKTAACNDLLSRVADADLMDIWRMRVMGRVRVEKTRAAAFRDFTLSHLIHHRGQFSVYLRLLGVPVPGSYGPTADEQF